MQENTDSSRSAILNELSNLRLGDLSTISEVREYLESTINAKLAALDEALMRIQEIGESNKAILNGNANSTPVMEQPITKDEAPAAVETSADDGTQIG